ncbi:IS630 family transposase [Zooshikella harenae]|uniref:IS630 family transposase n=1 Tax=Zooshikella harenae TaxID=2827238 RepID=A0ABS5Z9V5_9GAMM|nr:IS630 family transposase [Zooshikella harenae]MBU2710825.1 IS630 family transposase [Zooshikella harenae]
MKQVKDALLIDDETLRSYVEKYRSGGVKKLLETNYQGRLSHLNKSQCEQLKEELERKIYLTTYAVIEFIKEAFEVQYSPSGMRDLLHRLGYEFKKPKLVPGNPDVEAQETFAEQYEAFMSTKPVDIEVLFLDAVHPEHNTMAAYGWIKRGQKRPLPTNSGRQRLNLHGAVNAETMEMTVIESNTINKESTVQLLSMLDKKYESAKQIVVILDNARYHYSKEVKQLEEESPRLKLVYLPPYSPELNLIERVWKSFKKQVLYNKYYKNVCEFRKAAINFFSNIDQHARALKSLLDGGFENIYT